MKVIAVIVQKSGVNKATRSIATTVAAVADRLSAAVVDLAPPSHGRQGVSAFILHLTSKRVNSAT